MYIPPDLKRVADQHRRRVVRIGDSMYAYGLFRVEALPGEYRLLWGGTSLGVHPDADSLGEAAEALIERYRVSYRGSQSEEDAFKSVWARFLAVHRYHPPGQWIPLAELAVMFGGNEGLGYALYRLQAEGALTVDGPDGFPLRLSLGSATRVYQTGKNRALRVWVPQSGGGGDFYATFKVVSDGRNNESVRAIVDLDRTRSGKDVLTLRHPKHGGQFAKVLVEGGQGLLRRAVDAVYHQGAGDADAFFAAYGMSDEQAFNRDTWRDNPARPELPVVLQHAVVKIHERMGGPVSRAFQIATRNLQDAGVLHPGTHELTRYGVEVESRHAREPVEELRKKKARYEQMLAASRGEGRKKRGNVSSRHSDSCHCLVCKTGRAVLPRRMLSNDQHELLRAVEKAAARTAYFKLSVSLFDPGSTRDMVQKQQERFASELAMCKRKAEKARIDILTIEQYVQSGMLSGESDFRLGRDIDLT